jgi:glycerol-3-phosphate dehydrogenase
VLFGLLVPTIGITSPYELTIALIENAVKNGVELLLKHEVLDIHYDTCFNIETTKGNVESKFIINAAGLNAGKINNMLGNNQLSIHPRRGQYILFGKDQNQLNHVIFQTPNEKGKGILVTPTVHGNLMIGPDAEDLMDDLSTETSVERLSYIVEKARISYKHFNLKRALTTFSGIRAISESKDFFIDYVHEHAITVGGIDSPGLTSAPAIAEYVLDLILEKYPLDKKTSFNLYRKSYFDTDNGELICLCEEQGVNRIKNIFSGPIPIHSFDAVKRRLRTGMGNCQGRRCEDNVKQLISDHYKLKDVKKRTEEQMPKRVSIELIRKLES